MKKEEDEEEERRTRRKRRRIKKETPLSKGLVTSNSLQCALKRIRIECASNTDSYPLWNISHYQDAMRIEQ